jgi:Purple acid Phosphatase, N-terminal domain/Calcineurin-like phosphoesterase
MQKSSESKKHLIGGIFFLCIGIYFLISIILFLLYLPGEIPPESFYPGLIIIFITVGGFINWTIRFFKHLPVVAPKKKLFRVFLRSILTLWVIASIVVGMMGVYSFSQVNEFERQEFAPYLTWDTNQDPSSAITICWQTEIAVKSKLNYGLTRDNLNITVNSSNPLQYHFMSLSGLLPNTTYYYQAEGYEIKQFTTAPIGDFKFSFLWWSDPRTNGGIPGALWGENLPKRMSNLMKKDGSDFAFSMCTGDISTTALNNKTWEIWRKDIVTNDFGSNWSHVIAPGNHERSGNVTGEIFQRYYPYDVTPSVGSFCYSFDYGNTHFVMMDPWDAASGWWGGNKSVFADWLEQDLKINNDSKFTIMAMHPNPVLGDEHSGNQSLIMDVAVEYGVDLVLSGHWHRYETYKMDGTRIYPNSDVNTVGSLVVMQGEGGNAGIPFYATFAQIDISPTEITYRPRRVTGEWMEQFVITGV